MNMVDIKVHNMNEAKALVKEWNESGQHAGSSISFFKHENEEFLGRVDWADDEFGFIWQNI